jgi:cobalt-zinc-cadmium efflux system protein
VAEHHHHHDHSHPHHAVRGDATALRWAAALTLGFAAVEAAGGWWTGSLALISDAGHMLTDGAALGLAALAAWAARRPPSARHSYGLGRAEVFAALANALAMGSAAALVAGVVIAATGWLRVDAIASLAICLLIAVSALRITRESVHALMEGVPRGLSVDAVGLEMARVDGVVSVHDLHVWTLSGSRAALSAHVVVSNMRDWDRTLRALQERLHERFGIDHVTLQPESDARPLVRH